jgi:hypothetical protein
MHEQQDLGLLTQQLAPQYESSNGQGETYKRIDNEKIILEAKKNINRICAKYVGEKPFKDIEPKERDAISKVANWTVPQLDYLRKSREQGTRAIDCLIYAPFTTIMGSVFEGIHFVYVTFSVATIAYLPEMAPLGACTLFMGNRMFGKAAVDIASWAERNAKNDKEQFEKRRTRTSAI